MRKLLSIASLIVASAVLSQAVQTQADFNTDGLLFRNQVGGSLSAGGLGNGDGFAVQLGYFGGATTVNNFAGEWIPLTGQGSLNTAFATSSIGDGSGPNGEFYASFLFDSALPNSFNRLPPVGIPLALRFFNDVSASSATFYNTVSDDLWLWKTPGDPAPLPPQVLMSLLDPGLEWQSISREGQAPSSAFSTTIAIPEPSSTALGLFGLAVLCRFRRRCS